jgi:acetyl esterase/lipase
LSYHRRHLLSFVSSIYAAACRKSGIPYPETFSYGSHASQKFDLYKPQRAGDGLVVLIHGGGWQQGSRQDTAWLAPEFLSRGYIVANAGYRLLKHAPAPAAAEDIRHALDKVRQVTAAYGARPERTAIIGFSAGAHLALLAVLASAEQIRGPRFSAGAVVSFWGITDLADVVSGSNSREFAARWIGQTAEAERLSKRLSPIEYEPVSDTALLAIHSTRDPVVPFAHSERLVARWKDAGKPAELIRLEHEGHAADREAYPPLLNRVHRFLAERRKQGE